MSEMPPPNGNNCRLLRRLRERQFIPFAAEDASPSAQASLRLRSRPAARRPTGSLTLRLLSGRGSHEFGGRWNAAGTFPAVYCSLLPETAVTETMTRFRKTGLKARQPLPGVLISLSVKLQRVLDFTDPHDISVVEPFLAKAKRENWQYLQDKGREATGQAIGRAAHQLGIEGIRFPSAVVAGAKNLVVFPENLRARSILRIENAAVLRKFVHE